MTGTNVGHCEILEKAHRTCLDRLVARKFLSGGDGVSDADARALFIMPPFLEAVRSHPTTQRSSPTDILK